MNDSEECLQILIQTTLKTSFVTASNCRNQRNFKEKIARKWLKVKELKEVISYYFYE
jgi:hypothetical protein